MRICVFSDIHGNYPSFRIAFPAILAERADVNIFLGDLCGYYFDQLEVFPMLCKIPNLIAIAGNHDRMFLDIVNGKADLRKYYLNKYGRSMENLLAQDYITFADWLKSLPGFYEDPLKRFFCYHGSPKNPLEGYIYPDTSFEFMHELESGFYFLGHTHYEMYKKIGKSVIVNPGSLGQPRTGGWPTFAIVDLFDNRVRFKNVIYNKDALKERINEIGDENHYLSDVLDRKSKE